MENGSGSAEQVKSLSVLAHLFRRTRNGTRRSALVSESITDATVSSSPPPSIRPSTSPSHLHGERGGNVGQHHHHHHHHHHYYHHHHHHHRRRETNLPVSLVDVMPSSSSPTAEDDAGQLPLFQASPRTGNSRGPSQLFLAGSQPLRQSSRTRFSAAHSARNLPHTPSMDSTSFSPALSTAAASSSSQLGEVGDMDAVNRNLSTSAWTATTPLASGASRRHSRRGPLRRMLFRRQRWTLAEYDWTTYDFERSYLHPQHIRLLEYFDDLSHEEMLALAEHMGVVSCGLSEEELAKIPVEAISNVTDGGKAETDRMKDEERTCTICLDDFIKGDLARKLRCGHQFHVACVDPWLKQNKLCPVCKDDLEQCPSEKAADSGDGADHDRLAIRNP